MIDTFSRFSKDSVRQRRDKIAQKWPTGICRPLLCGESEIPRRCACGISVPSRGVLLVLAENMPYGYP